MVDRPFCLALTGMLMSLKTITLINCWVPHLTHVARDWIFPPAKTTIKWGKMYEKNALPVMAPSDKKQQFLRDRNKQDSLAINSVYSWLVPTAVQERETQANTVELLHWETKLRDHGNQGNLSSRQRLFMEKRTKQIKNSETWESSSQQVLNRLLIRVCLHVTRPLESGRRKNYRGCNSNWCTKQTENFMEHWEE